MKFPIGVQSFEALREEGLVYVDKTDMIYKLTNSFKYVFLGRPRRFGKSLLMSTIQAYLEGKKNLFRGLAIEDLEQDWAAHPVLHFDFNIGNYSSVEGLMNLLNVQLSKYEKSYSIPKSEQEPQFRLQNLIQESARQTGRKAVVLVDEYDKPVLQAIGNKSLDEEFRKILKPFFGVMKTEDLNIRYAMFTGVSKFGKLSVFSDMNNLEDINLNKDYAAICGLTKQEILSTFSTEIDEFAKEYEVTREELTERLRAKYDGYRFTKARTLVFNPFSLLSSIKYREFGDYWFQTGTPTFLVELLKKNDYDLSHIEGAEADADSLYMVDNISAIPMLYQTGYLTIKDYEEDAGLCILGYPNHEVESAFLRFLIPYYSKTRDKDSKSELFRLVKEIKAGEVEAFMTRLQSLFSGIPYSHDNSAKAQEDQVRNLLYLIFKLMSMQIQVECPMSKGRSDAIVWTSDHIYVFEFKIDRTAEEAIDQIRKNGYAEPFRADSRQVILIGVNYSTEQRCIDNYLVAND